MRYLSFDLEATGLDEKDYIIEFAMIPFDSETQTFEEELADRFLVKCPEFEELKPNLNQWVIKNNKTLIEAAAKDGITTLQFKERMEKYLTDPRVTKYFGKEKVVLFGKSMSAIDIPFLTRDLGWEWMNKYFQHRNLDLSCLAYGLIDMGILPKGCDSGSVLMKHLNMGNVAHTALEDARNTAIMYFKIMDLYKCKIDQK